MTCFRNGASNELREFGGTTRELLKIADWLTENKCEMIAMESTASYWKSLYNIFESAAWIADLLQYGLLKASYIPDWNQRELRGLVSYRKNLVQEKNRELN